MVVLVLPWNPIFATFKGFMESPPHNVNSLAVPSSNHPNLDTILYPTHVSFDGDILNSGLAFVLLLMIIISIILAQLLNLGEYCDLSMHLLDSLFLHHFSATLFFLTAMSWDTIHAICAIISQPLERQSSKLRKNKIKGRHTLFHFPRRWIILSDIMINGKG